MGRKREGQDDVSPFIMVKDHERGERKKEKPPEDVRERKRGGDVERDARRLAAGGAPPSLFGCIEKEEKERERDHSVDKCLAVRSCPLFHLSL